MNIKFAIFIIIASILTMAIYSSSINLVSAAGREIRVCVWDTSKPGQASCSRTDTTGVRTDYNCNYDATTKKWNCVKAKTSSSTPNQMPGSETLKKFADTEIPLGLKSALDSAIKSQNDGLVIGQSNTPVTNSSESTINNPPQTSSQIPDEVIQGKSGSGGG